MTDASQPEVKYYGFTIPVHVEIDAKQVVLAQPEMREILRGAQIIALGNCGCRRDAAVCDHPLEVCLAIDDDGRDEIEKHAWREISVDEALAVLETSHRAGLVHVAYRKKDEPITMVCSCCACACNPLRRLKGRDYREEITESAYVTRFDAAACVGCGTCIGRCPFEAFSRGDGSGVSFDEKKCFGCGLCVSTCPAAALALVRRSSGPA
jgi:Na+-translocating ferredoxin:NAD+ oxidoreductase subunit B